MTRLADAMIRLPKRDPHEYGGNWVGPVALKLDCVLSWVLCQLGELGLECRCVPFVGLGAALHCLR